MALKIKEGSEIYPYGKVGKCFTSKDDLPQDVLEHLQSRFPDDIEEVNNSNKQSKNKQ